LKALVRLMDCIAFGGYHSTGWLSTVAEGQGLTGVSNGATIKVEWRQGRAAREEVNDDEVEQD
jgi:hypothetical protein